MTQARDGVRLADFIEANVAPILVEWVAFAKTFDPAGMMDLAALRDHATEMLRSIVTDLRTPQSDDEQSEKSKGQADAPEGAPDTPAEVHGAGRASSGFSVGEMVSEYRALRASVIRLWTRANSTLTSDDFEDLLRFNEAIDQALAESLTRYTQDLDQSKEMFIAILGHDLRTPIGAIVTSSRFMLDLGKLVEPELSLTTRVHRSAQRMNRMVSELLDFTRIRLGSGIPIVRADVDLAALIRESIDELTAARPATKVEFNSAGDVRGSFDAERIAQVITNLLDNAASHGTADSPIRVTLRGRADDVVLSVHNRGPAIPARDLPNLFSPLKLLRPGAPGRKSAHLGLGLFIADQIVSAHAGTFDVASSNDSGTAFTVRLPRATAKAAKG